MNWGQTGEKLLLFPRFQRRICIQVMISTARTALIQEVRWKLQNFNVLRHRLFLTNSTINIPHRDIVSSSSQISLPSPNK